MVITAIGGVILAQQPQAPSPAGAIVGSFIPVGAQLELVTDAPYSAERVYGGFRVLPDGTRADIPASSSTKLYRDSQGRTREENVAISPSGERTVSTVTIGDPIEGVRYTLDPKTRMATRTKAAVRQAAQAGARPPVGPSGPNTTRESLGLQTVNGVPAQGERVTLTIPAGVVNSDQPIVDITETWTSAELQMTVRQVVRSSTRGETTVELTNISRQEPDPSLFRVPAEYQVR